MPFLFKIRANGEAIERWEIGNEPVIIGRGERADVRIEDERLSREHFAILRDGNAFVISDLDSTNGTWVGGRRISRTELGPNQQIRAGRTILRFEEGLTSVMCELENRLDHATKLLL